MISNLNKANCCYMRFLYDSIMVYGWVVFLLALCINKSCFKIILFPLFV